MKKMWIIVACCSVPVFFVYHYSQNQTVSTPRKISKSASIFKSSSKAKISKVQSLVSSNLPSSSSILKAPQTSEITSKNYVKFSPTISSSKMIVSHSFKQVNQNQEYDNFIKSKPLHKAKSKVNLKTTEEAADYLRGVLGYNDPNIMIGGSDEFNGVDDRGKYYTLQITYLPHRLQNKTGLMGRYIVYSNGDYVQIT